MFIIADFSALRSRLLHSILFQPRAIASYIIFVNLKLRLRDIYNAQHWKDDKPNVRSVPQILPDISVNDDAVIQHGQDPLALLSERGDGDVFVFALPVSVYIVEEVSC